MNSSFKKCMHNNTNTTEALRCCMINCRKNPNCQEKCIESYNSLIPVTESFLPLNRKIGFLISTIIFHSLVILGYIILPADKKMAITKIIFIYISLYYCINYIL